jgi:hypothetical protein
MHIPGVILAILIGGVLFDLDSWRIVLAIFICGLLGWFIGGATHEMGAPGDVVSDTSRQIVIRSSSLRRGCVMKQRTKCALTRRASRRGPERTRQFSFPLFRQPV